MSTQFISSLPFLFFEKKKHIHENFKNLLKYSHFMKPYCTHLQVLILRF